MRTGQTTNGHLCGVSFAADPDEGRTRGTHSLAGNRPALELIGHAPRRSKPVVINACRHAAVESRSPEGDVVVAARLVGRSGRQREVFAPAQHRPGHAGVLRRNGHHGLPVAASRLQRRGPVADGVGLALGCCQHSARAQHQQAAQVAVTRLGDAPQPRLAARAVLAWCQAQPGGELPPAVEVVAVADHGQQTGGGGGAHAAELHQALGSGVLLGHSPDVEVVLGDARVQSGDLTEQVTDHRVGITRQILQAVAGPAAHGVGLERQHDAELAQAAADAVERGGALLDKALASPVHHQRGLLFEGLDWHEAHVRALDGFADRRGISGVVLAPLAAHAVGRDELRRDQPHRVARRLKQPRPMVRARASLHADHARRQRVNQRVQRVARHGRAHQLGFASLVEAMHRENILGKINTSGQNRHGLPLPDELMRNSASHRGTQLLVAATRLARDGEVPFIRWALTEKQS